MEEYNIYRLVPTNGWFTRAYLGSKAAAFPQLNKHDLTN
jgi:hypothetical protein